MVRVGIVGIGFMGMIRGQIARATKERRQSVKPRHKTFRARLPAVWLGPPVRSNCRAGG
jgi:hypothetical protein